MRVGIVSWWFNRGQAVVARQVRSALDSLGHETFVLARPTAEGDMRPDFIDRGDVWDQPGVTEASAYEVPLPEYRRFVAETGIEVLLCDQNYQFEQLSQLRRDGLRVVGRFVWEQFEPSNVPDALEAYDVIYSLTGCERERYADLGIESPRVHWGIHPELLEVEPEPRPLDGVLFFYPGGYLTKRKPIDEVLSAFAAVEGAGMKLLLKMQAARKMRRLREAVERDPRVELRTDDLPTAEHLRLFAAADVCLAPTRWEGLGLHLYEATAFGVPLIVNDNPPMNEVVEDGVNGLLVPGLRSEIEAPSGIPAFDPDPAALSAAIERLADPDERSRLAQRAPIARDRLSWDRTVAGYRDLIDSVS